MPLNIRKKRDVVAKILEEEDVYIPTLYVILAELYGDTLFEQEVALIFNDLEEFTGIPALPLDVENKINALLTLMTTDAFYEDRMAFIAICNTLNNGDPDLDEWDMPTLEDVFWAILETSFLDEEPPEFAPEISELIAGLIKEEVADVDNPLDTEYVQDQYRRMRDQLSLVNEAALSWPDRMTA